VAAAENNLKQCVIKNCRIPKLGKLIVKLKQILLFAVLLRVFNK
jgi:hypothetical protein